MITLSFQKKLFGGIWCCHIDHVLLESSSWYGFAKSLNQFFISSHHVLELYVLNIKENYLVWQLSWKFSYTLRTNDSVEHVKSFVNCAIHLFILLSWSHFFSACENLPSSTCHFWTHKSRWFEKWHKKFG